jgi:DNA-binding response OmpR family regulator
MQGKHGVPSAADVLVVEDEPTIAVTLCDELADHGYRVTHTANGDDALRLVASRAFAAVITDLRLPGATGFEVLAACKRVECAPRTLVMSAYLGDLHDAHRGHDADLVLQKPFANTRVVEWLRGIA